MTNPKTFFFALKFYMLISSLLTKNRVNYNQVGHLNSVNGLKVKNAKMKVFFSKIWVSLLAISNRKSAPQIKFLYVTLYSFRIVEFSSPVYFPLLLKNGGVIHPMAGTVSTHYETSQQRM